MKSIKQALLLLSLSIFVGGCSVGMAMSGKKEPNLAVCQIGADRGTVELQLGSPTSIATTSDGNIVAIYEYEQGNEPSAGRAAFHGTMDLLTLGGWELIGTPVEGFIGDKKQLTVEYDKNNKIASINSTVRPVASNAPAEQGSIATATK